MHEFLGETEELTIKGKTGHTWDCSCGRRGSTVLPHLQIYQKWYRHQQGRVRKGEV